MPRGRAPCRLLLNPHKGSGGSGRDETGEEHSINGEREQFLSSGGGIPRIGNGIRTGTT